jgi:hypothetical protein
MIPPHLEQQIRANMEETRTAALLATMFQRINQNQETTARAREDEKLLRARYWWQERDK